MLFRSTPQQKDLSLNLSSSQSENALKQLKTLTSPLSKLAKGMQSFGMNLDPRKITVKVRDSIFCDQLSVEQPADFIITRWSFMEYVKQVRKRSKIGIKM